MAKADVKSGRSAKVLTPEFRVSFPVLFKPRSIEEGGRPKFSVVMLFAKGADLSSLKAAAHAACVGAWGKDEKKWPSNLRKPFRDQGEKESEGYVPGAIFVSASSIQQPGVVGSNVEPITDESEVYAGCYGRATVNAYTYSVKGNSGVTFGLINFQKTRDGESLTMRSRPSEDFNPIEDTDDEKAF